MTDKSFKRYTIEEYIAYLSAFKDKIHFSEIHVHHTYKPTIADFRNQANKERLIRAMWRYHTGTRGWRDIAQHATIDPDGFIWEGRPLTEPPASSTGYNDADADLTHPFMFEMIGNFDINHENLEGAQLQTTLQLVATLINQWSLSLNHIRFHREMAPYKSCPGSGVDKGTFIAQVNKTLSEIRERAASKNESEPDSNIPKISERIPIIISETDMIFGYLIEGVTYAPLRRIAESLNAQVEWDAGSRTATIKKAGEN